MGTTTPVCHSKGTDPDLHAMLHRCVNHDSPTTSRDFSISGRILSTPGDLLLRSFLTTSLTSTREMVSNPAKSSISASPVEGMEAWLRSSFHRPTMSPVQVRSSLPCCKQLGL
ncbi:hypothetical protein LDENG_00196960 [Lucifuga dentata]|nr:hypothetical protein LDENG_00196960 [Lucifuga dentata]